MRAMYVLIPEWPDSWPGADGTQYIHAMRLFKEEPKWTPLNRSGDVDENPYRKEYVSQFLA